MILRSAHTLLSGLLFIPYMEGIMRYTILSLKMKEVTHQHHHHHHHLFCVVSVGFYTDVNVAVVYFVVFAVFT